jgi:hypothetical protein
MSALNPLKLDTMMLTSLVRAVLENGAAEVMNWEVTPIVQGRASPAAVYRIAGSAQTQDGVAPWSLVLKESHPPSSSTVGDKPSNDPKSWWYWKRELLLYQSGLFDELPEGFATPQVYCIEDEPEFNRIWMEDVREDVGTIFARRHPDGNVETVVLDWGCTGIGARGLIAPQDKA